MTSAWVSPEIWPPGSQKAEGRGPVTLSDGLVPVRLPAPVLSGETELLTRPSAALCFPAHPFGAVRLYGYARAELDQTVSSGDVAPSERDIYRLEESLWKETLTCYLPGDSIRGGFDRLMEKKVRSLRQGDGEIEAKDVARIRLQLLAVHLVAVGLGRWAGEAQQK